MTPLASRPLRVLAAGCLLAGCSGTTESPPLGLHHPALAVRDSVALSGTPFAVAVSRTGVVYVSRILTDSVARADLPSASFTAMVPVGYLASQVRISPDGATAYVSNQDAGTITFVHVASGQPFDTVAVDGSVLTVGLHPNGRRLYALTDYYGVYVIDVATRRVIDSISATLAGTLLTGVAFHPSVPLMYIAARDAGTITVFDTRTDLVVTRYTVSGGRTQNVAVTKDGSELYATDIQRSGLVIWNLQSGSAAYQELLIGSGQVRNAFDVAVTPDDAQLYVSALADGKVYVLDRATRMVVGTIVTGGSPRYVAFNAEGTHAVIPNELGWVDFVR